MTRGRAPPVRLVEQLQRLPGIGAKGAQRHRISFTASASRRRRGSSRRAIRDVKEQHHLLLDLPRTSPTPIPCYYCTRSTDATARDHLCRRGCHTTWRSVENGPRTSRVAYHVLMGALSPLQGVGPRRLANQESARTGRVADGVDRDHRGHEPQRRRRGDRNLSGEATQAARCSRDPHRDGPTGRQRSRVRRRGHDA